MRYLVLLLLFLVTSCGGQSKEDMVREGDSLLSSGNTRGAIVLYRNALEKDANYLQARTGLADAYLKAGQFDRAENEFQKILLQDPSRTETHLQLAEVSLLQRQSEKALLELDAYHNDHAETVASLVLYGRAHGQAGDLESAAGFFLKAQAEDPQSVDPYYYLARVYLQQEQLDKAEKQLRKAVALEELKPDVYYLLAAILARQGRSDEALQVYQGLLEKDPEQLQAAYMACILLMDKGDVEAAEDAVGQMEKTFSGRPEVSRLRGMLLYRKGQYEQANVALEASIQAQPHILAYLFSGLSYYNLEQYELAINQFQKTLDINPQFERGRILVATTLLKQKRTADAIIEIQKVLRANPNNAYAHNILGSAYLAQGDYDKGMSELEVATELDPNLADAHFKRGLFHLVKGAGAEGEADLVKAVEAAPEVLNSRLMLVTHYLRQKNYADAIRILQEGMTGDKSDALLKNYLAAAYFAQKKNDEALKALQEARTIDPAYLTPAFNLASYYASRARYDDAISEYDAILQQDSANVRAMLGKIAVHNLQGNKEEIPALYTQIEGIGTEEGFFINARYLLQARKTEEALAAVERGLQKFPESAGLLELQGGLLLMNKKYSEAQGAFEKLATVDPEKGYSSLVRLYLLQNQPDKADSLIQDLLQQHPDQDYPYLLSSGILLSQRKLAEAQDIVQKGQSRVGESLRLDMQLARLLEAEGKSSQAMQLYQRIIGKAPRFAPAHVSLGYLKEQGGDKSAALDLYRKAVTLDQRNVSGLNNLAYLLADNFGEVKEGLELALKAYRLEPGDPRIMDTLGYLLLLNDKHDDAVKLLARAHEMLPQIPTVALHYGKALMATGDKEKGQEILQGVAENGTSEEKKQARQLLSQ